MKLNLSVKNIMRVLGFISIIVIFCPTFLVSCDSIETETEIGLKEMIFGMEYYGETVIEPQPVLLVFLLFPLLIILALYSKSKKEKATAIGIIIYSVIDIAMWIGLKYLMEESGREALCTVKTTFWYKLNIIGLVALIVLSGIIIAGKLRLDSLFYAINVASNDNMVVNNENSYINNEVSLDKSTENEKIISPNTGSTDTIKNKCNKIMDKIKSLSKKQLIAVCCGGVVLVVAIVGTFLFIDKQKTINLNEYITVKTSGYNGYGEAEVDINWKEIEKKYGDKLKINKDAKEEFGGLLSMMGPVDVLKEYIDIEIDKESNLSNGDKIKYTWEIDSKLYRFLDGKIKYKDNTHKVSGLKDVDKFDAFKDLEVEFSGIAPSGEANITYNGKILNESDFECDNTSELKNGDEITVTIDKSIIEDCIESSGKIPEKMEKKYKVSGLDAYVENYSELTKEFIVKVRKDAEDTILSYIANNYNSWKVSGLKYNGYIMRYLEGEAGYNDYYNELYIIYSGVIYDTEKSFSKKNIYYPVKFTDLLKVKDEIEYDDNKGIQGSSKIVGWSSSSGYLNPMQCYLDNSDTEDGEYVSIAGDGFEKYNEYTVVTSLDDISGDNKNKILSSAKVEISNYIASDYDSSSKIKNVKFVGEYLLKNKNIEDTSDIEEKNSYIVVYSAVVYSTDKSFKATTVYFPVEYDGVIKLKNGEYGAYYDGEVIGESYFPDSYYGTDGYIDGKEMYKEIITANRDEYEYEVSEGLQKFGK